MTAKNPHPLLPSLLLPLTLCVACAPGAGPSATAQPAAAAASASPLLHGGPDLVFRLEVARTARGIRQMMEHFALDDSRYTTEEREQAALARFGVLAALVLLLRVEHADEPGWEDRFDQAVIRIVRAVVGVSESQLPDDSAPPESEDEQNPPANERGLRLGPGQRGA